MRPKVSILIPAYNGSRFIAESLESALSQTFKDFELLVVDDGSTDDTLDIVKKYQKADSRIRIIENPVNLGLIRNCNHTIFLARGKWIKFLFQDDLLEENAIECMLDAAVSHDKKLVISRRRYIFEPEVTDETSFWFTEKLPQISDLIPGKTLIDPKAISRAAFEWFPKNIIGEPVASLFHKSLIERYGILNEDIIQMCDYEYFLKIASAEGLAFLDEPLVTFRVHKSSCSASNFASGNFRAHYCDRLILSHEMTFSPEYKAFREHVLSSNPRVDFIDRFAYYARDIYRRAQESESNQKSLEKIVNKYPMMEVASRRIKIFSVIINRILKRKLV